MLTGGIVARMRGLIVKTVVAMTAVVAVVGAGVWLVGQVKLSSAKFMQNDNTGSFVVSMEDMAGISSKTDSVVVSSNLATLGDGETTGDFVTGDITPSSSGGWENIKVEGAWGQRDAVRVQILDCSGVLLNLPGNTEGLVLSNTGEVDISTLSVAQACIRVRVLLDGSAGGAAPSINSVTVNWVPATVYMVRVSGTPSVLAGETINYKVDYSVSYSDDVGTIVYVPLPAVVSGSYTEEYGQDLGLIYGGASNGGKYTTTEIVVNGVTVPANSVYWELGDVKAGSTSSLSFALRTQNGWENGVRYQATATIVSGKTAAKRSGQATTVVNSSPKPVLDKNVSNTIPVNGVDYAYLTAPYNGVVNYNISFENTTYGSTVGMETMFNPVVTDDISEIMSFLTDVCSVDAGSRIKFGSDAELDGATITWTLDGDIGPMDSRVVSFSVDYSGCPEGEVVENTAIGKSDKTNDLRDTAAVRLFDVPLVNGNVAKGENNEIRAYVDDDAPSSDLTDMRGKVAYGGTTTYRLMAQNSALLPLGDVVMQDMIPVGTTFVSASLPTGVGGKIYYYTAGDHTDPLEAPAFDYANGATNPGAGWSEIVPNNPADVKWITMYVPCLKSGITAGITSDCDDKASSVVGNVTVRINPATDVCKNTVINNVGILGIYSSGTSVDDPNTMIPIGNPFTLKDNEPTLAVSPLPILSSGSGIGGLANVEAGDTVDYNITLRNTSATEATATDTVLLVEIPSVQVGSQMRPLEYLGFTGGTVQKTNTDASGNTVSLEILPGVLAPGMVRSYGLTLGVPRGALSGASYEVRMTLTAKDEMNCQTIVTTKTAQSTINGLPQLNTVKTRDENLIESAGSIRYHVQLNSSGTVSTTNTFVIDQIPKKAVFESTSCPADKCTVFFAADGDPDLPSVITPMDPMSVDMVYANFSRGVQNGDTWVPPASITNSNVGYIAYLVGDTHGDSRILGVGESMQIDLRVRNDDDGSGSGEDGSKTGSIISNAPIILSDQSLQAIGNTVHTTVLAMPGLVIDKTTDVNGAVQNSHTFNWFVDYRNDGSQDDTSVVFTDTLPAGVTLEGLYNTWSDQAVANGAPAGEYDLLDSANDAGVSVTENADGTATVVVHLVPEQRSGLAAGNANAGTIGEGGRLRLAVRVKDDEQSGTYLINNVSGCYGNEVEGPTCITDESSVEVQNPDLWLRKTVSDTEPHVGEELSYTVTVSNEGRVDAPGVVITDSLPAGLCYKAGSVSVLPNGWSLGDPVVSGGDCTRNATILTWSGDGAIKHKDYERGLIPGSSGNIRIGYVVTVSDDVEFGTELDNIAKVTTTETEDDVYPNEDATEVKTAIPDPYIEKRASMPSVLPGETFNYTIGYGNTADEKVTGAYIVDGLPDIDGDGRTDVTILSVIVMNDEVVYYYDENSSGELLPEMSASYDFAANSNFKTSLADFDPTDADNPSYPTHIVIVNTGRAGGGDMDYHEYSGQIRIEALATDPYSGEILPAGSEWVNYVEIGSETEDSDLTNNKSSATVAVPSADLTIDKSASMEGSYPGLAPGDSINYTVTYRNSGVGSVCAVWVQDALPDVIASYTHDFQYVTITDKLGNAMQLLDKSGSPIPGSVRIQATYDSSEPGRPKWYLGSTADENATDHYTNVCLPTGAQGEFNINAVLDMDLADETPVLNSVHVDQDSGAIEQIMTNNDDSSETMVYLADLMLLKSGLSAGRDGVFGTEDDSETEVNASDRIQYTLEYNNIGSITAKNSVITENIPVDTCFTIGSILNLPATAKVSYSNDDGSTWYYAPAGGNGAEDCNVTAFRVELGDLSAPANMLSGEMRLEAVSGVAEYDEVVMDVLKGKTISGVAAGASHTCVIADGKVYCWGSDNYGQLGDANYVSAAEPIAVDDSGVLKDKVLTQISAQENTTCAIDTDGKAYCWGRGYYGMLGNGSTNDVNTPAAVTDNGVLAGKQLTQIDVGRYHVCALDSIGWAYCWGMGTSGQLGNGQNLGSSEPVLVTEPYPDGKFTQIVSGAAFTCGIGAADQSAYCWGANNLGQLGNDASSLTTRNVPTLVKSDGVLNGLTIEKLSATYDTICAIASDGKPYCWGSSSNGMLGNGGGTYGTVPVAVVTTGVLSEKRLVDIESGTYSFCAVDEARSAYCWGLNTYSQLGDETTDTGTVPVAAIVTDDMDNKTISRITLGAYHTCAVMMDGQMYCWGYDGNGQLGDGETLDSSDSTHKTAVKVETMREIAKSETVRPFQADVVNIESYGSTSCAVKDGKAYCWGDNIYGKLGDGTTKSSPVAVEVKMEGELAGKMVKDVRASLDHSCLLTTEGKVYCWGVNNGGQIGDGTMINKLSPTAIDMTGELSGKTIQSISLGSGFTCALASDGKVYCWGVNTNGSIGNGEVFGNFLSPTAVDTSGVLAGKTVKEVKSTYLSTCVLDMEGKAYCWGLGAIGNGTTQSTSPSAVDTSGVLSGKTLKKIGVGYMSSCAMDTQNEVYCWGMNETGQLGDGTTTMSYVPVRVKLDGELAGKTVEQLTVGYSHSCVIASDDRLYCWGSNMYGALGSGNPDESFSDPGSFKTEPTAVETAGSVMDGKAIRSVDAGAFYTCAMDYEDYAYCWGWDTYGMLGQGHLDHTQKQYNIEPNYVLIGAGRPTSVQDATILSAEAEAVIVNYESLYIDQVAGPTIFPNAQYPDTEGSVDYYFKQTDGATCDISSPDVPGFGSPVWTAPANATTSTLINISGLDKNVRNWCVVADYKDSGDVISTARMSYGSPDNPYIKFGVKVSEDAVATKIQNNASIDTTTPEITKENNDDDYEFRVPLADLSLVKTVDWAAVSAEDLVGGTKQLTYTMAITNGGPNDAYKPVVTDILPLELHFVSAEQISSSDGADGESTVSFVCTGAGSTVTCSSDSLLKAGESAKIELVVTIDISVANNSRLNNIACVTSGTVDAETSDNCDAVITTITTAPNVWAKKTGAAVANIGKRIEYTIEFGNNGNAPAEDFSLTDTLPEGLTVVADSFAVTMSDGVAPVSCSVAFGNPRRVNCFITDGSALPAGVSGAVTMLVEVANNQQLVDDAAVLSNEVCASTTSTQTDISDDCDDHDVRVVPGELGAIGGYVYIDTDLDGHFDMGDDEKGMAGVTVTLTGVDTKGREVSMSTTTEEDGSYYFGNLYPGAYDITESQPDNYNSTASTSGYFMLNEYGFPEYSDDESEGKGMLQIGSDADPNLVTGIVIREGDYSQHNDFGEVSGTIGNYVWLDADWDGFADAEERGIAGVEMSLYRDMDGDGRVTANDLLVTTTFTDDRGYYYFRGLDLAHGPQYLVAVTDCDEVLASSDLLPTYVDDDAYYDDDGYSANRKDGGAYGALIELILDIEFPEIQPAATKLREDGGEVVALATQAIAVRKPRMLLAADGTVDSTTNLTADFGFATEEVVEPPVTPPTPTATVTPTPTPTPTPGDGGKTPETPNTGFGFLGGDVLVPVGITGAVATISGLAFAGYRIRRGKNEKR